MGGAGGGASSSQRQRVMVAALLLPMLSLHALPNAPPGATMSAVHVVGHCTAAQRFSCVGSTTSAQIPAPAAGQILIKVAGSSVNPCDSDTVRGKPGCPLNAAGIPGGDVAGTVVKCPGCTRLKVGDTVWANRFGLAGGMAEFAVATELQTGLAPRNLALADAGTVPIVGGTSLQCLRCLERASTRTPVAAATALDDRAANPCPESSTKRPLENMTVVITSGSGGTGYLAIQMARALGATKVITAASGTAAISWMKSLGATTVCDLRLLLVPLLLLLLQGVHAQVSDYKNVDVFAGLPDDSVDAVFDNYAGNGTADRAMPKLRAGGAYLLLPDGDSTAGLSKHPKAGVRQINFGDVDQTHHRTLDEIAAMFEAGTRCPPPPSHCLRRRDAALERPL